MPRPPRADEANGLYHALNRGNLRADIFKKEADYTAFEDILQEGLEIHQVELYGGWHCWVPLLACPAVRTLRQYSLTISV